ncbi:MAG: beta-ketoacyl-ACP synthase III [Alphaproteobacteria bacterium]
MTRRSLILGSGAYLPERILTNGELAERIDTSDAWIVERTGIRERRIAGEGEKTSDLAVHAADAALSDAGLRADEVDLIVVATSTPDETFPSCATMVQAGLGITRGIAFDVQAVCSGFVYALATADNFIRTGQAATALVVGAETFSRILDWDDRATCILFGDGAGAVTLRAGDGNGSAGDRGVLSTHLHADGRYHDLLYVDGGPGSTGKVGYLRMQGREVFRHAVVLLAAAVDEALAAHGLGAGDIDWFVPHQANRRIIDAMAKRLGLSADKVVVTIERHANTSAASIPLALTEASHDGRIKPGDLVLIEAMGGGFTWASGILRW